MEEGRGKGGGGVKRGSSVLHRSPHCLSNVGVERGGVGCRTHAPLMLR